MSVTAFAQKGESAVGVSLGYTPVLQSGVSVSNFGLSARYQYGITDALRGEAIVGYDFKDNGMSFFTVGVNAHYLFNVGQKLQVYPLVGFGYANCKGSVSVEDEGDSRNNYYNNSDEEYAMIEGGSEGKFYYNVGLGAQYPLTDRLSANLEVKFQGIKDCNRLPISIGVIYKF